MPRCPGVAAQTPWGWPFCRAAAPMTASLSLLVPNASRRQVAMPRQATAGEIEQPASDGLWPSGAKSRTLAPATAILQRHWQHKSSVEETTLELYHGDISVAKAEEIARLLW